MCWQFSSWDKAENYHVYHHAQVSCLLLAIVTNYIEIPLTYPIDYAILCYTLPESVIFNLLVCNGWRAPTVWSGSDENSQRDKDK